jgi:ATP-dependent Lon protease
MPDGNIKVLVEGVERARSIAGERRPTASICRRPCARCKTLCAGDDAAGGSELMHRVHPRCLSSTSSCSQSLNQETMAATVRAGRAREVGDTIAANLQLVDRREAATAGCLRPGDAAERAWADVLDVAIEKLNMDRTIQSRVKRQMEKAQKEYYLNEKIKAIQKELGRGEKSRVRRAEEKDRSAGMPKDVLEKSDCRS